MDLADNFLFTSNYRVKIFGVVANRFASKQCFDHHGLHPEVLERSPDGLYLLKCQLVVFFAPLR